MPARQVFPDLNAETVAAVAGLFRVEPVVEPFSPDGTPVYRLSLAGEADGIRIIVWPSLGRVDVSSTRDHAWVLKDVGTVEIVPGVEVIFRPRTVKGFLFVSVNGWVNMVIG